MFEIGQQVVCIDDNFQDLLGREVNCPHRPVRGQVLTIRGIHEWEFANLIGFTFYELRNPEPAGPGMPDEAAFLSDCFRPVRKTDISIFTKMLTPSGQRLRNMHEQRRQARPAPKRPADPQRA